MAKLSAAEDKDSRNEAALINLQCALEQFQNSKSNIFVGGVERHLDVIGGDGMTKRMRIAQSRSSDNESFFNRFHKSVYKFFLVALQILKTYAWVSTANKLPYCLSVQTIQNGWIDALYHRPISYCFKTATLGFG